MMHYFSILAFTTMVVMSHPVVSAQQQDIGSTTIIEQQHSRLRHLTECDALKACYLINIETRTETLLVPGNKANNTVMLDLTKHPRGYSIRCDVRDVEPNGELDFIKFLYDDVEHDEFGLPRYMNGDAKEGAYINSIPYMQSCGTKIVRVQGHVWSKKCFDRNYQINLKCPTTSNDNCPPRITDFILVDAVKRTDIRSLSSYSIADIMPSNQLSIRAVPKLCVPKNVDSVQFILDGTTIRCEKYVPYSLFGDESTTDRIVTDGALYNTKPISIGRHTIKAIPYSGAECTGTIHTAGSLTRTFTVRA